MIPYFKDGFIRIGKERVPPVYKGEHLDLEGNYRLISIIRHAARLVESLVFSQLFSTTKVTISYPMTNLRILNDTLLKLAFTKWSMIGLKT